MLVRYEGPAADAANAIRKAAASVDANVTPLVRRVEETMDSVLSPVRIAAAAATGLGVVALLLAATGIYGVVAFAIGRRRREVGIRMALGADRTAVCRLVLWQGMKPVLIGGLIGLVLAGTTSQLIRVMLYGISPLDPVSFAGTCALLALAALIAMAWPVRQALGVDPAVTLRYE
jgi:putative ABC transport system permease protein